MCHLGMLVVPFIYTLAVLLVLLFLITWKKKEGIKV